MDQFWKTILWNQFGASIDMFGNALRSWPDELWGARLWDHPGEPPVYSQFWYLGYHTLFWLDLYLTGEVEGFAPPPPFTLSELDPNGMPEYAHTKEELFAYLEHCRRKCRSTVEALTDETARRLCRFRWGEVSFAELQLYNMRHVQEHAAQLSLLLGQAAGSAARWVVRGQSAAEQ